MAGKQVATARGKRPSGNLVFDIVIKKFKQVKVDKTQKDRHDIHYDVTLQVNGGELEGSVHLMSLASKKTKAGKNWNVSSEWHTHNGVRSNTYHDCIECNGNDGRAGPLTSGETAIAFAKVIFAHLESLGFVLQLRDYSSGGWFWFQVRSPRLSSHRTNRKTRYMYTVYAETIVCPIHGKHIQYVHECDV